MVYSVTIFYVMFYFAMGMIMTWAFFCYMLAMGIGGALLGRHLISFHKGSPRGAYLLVGILSLLTVMLGGYSREAARPRFVNRISHYDSVFVPEDRQPYLFRKEITSKDLPEVPVRPKPSAASVLIRQSCIGCHTLERVKAYKLDNWELIIRQMMAYGLKLTPDEFKTITKHLESKKPY
jgi:hypothetical protein